LKSGIIGAVFHCVGNSNLESDKLNKRERGTLFQVLKFVKYQELY
jgi:hypothetical protein